uniref:Uncharacterized protein n=1 Tax=Anguilla anguilla TaxID=7936 RepID=A0A0E9PSH6_ANGAN
MLSYKIITYSPKCLINYLWIIITG